MFAAKRTDKLTGRTKYENNSRININGISHNGVPDGRNILKKPSPFFANVINIQRTKIITANEKVIDIWLVWAKEPGINPNRFNNKTNKNIENTNGTYFFPAFPKELLTISLIVNKDNSNADCPTDGNSFFSFFKKNQNANRIKIVAQSTIEPFVILKLYPKNLILTKFSNSNWCIGFTVALIFNQTDCVICFFICKQDGERNNKYIIIPTSI